jgi:hypothetical protein
MRFIHRTAPFSRWTLLLLFAVLLTTRVVLLTPNELSWDVFGYYLPLPATFIHHDPLLHDIAWIEQVRAQYGTTETLYQITQAPDGSPMYFFLFGMAMLYLPCFALGHALALITGAPADGFSAPYQQALALGCMVYVLVGLVHLRRILLQFLPDRLAALLIAIVGFGTNYFHFTTTKDLETASFLFCGMSVLVWNTLRWHTGHRRRNLLGIAISIALITLVKPSEIGCGMIPLLWGVHDRATFRARIALLGARWKELLLAAVVGLVVLSPQLLYWYTKTGRPLFDSYRNPGVGLDLASPHILPILFSAKKGWLLYTPVMALALAGFITLYRRRKDLFPVVLAYFLTTFYIIASWSEWWYGASFSVRPMITSYVLLTLPLGHLLQAVGERGLPWRASMGAVVAACIALNLFQTWQLNHWVLDPYRTTWAYYKAIFGRTSVPPGAEALKSLEPDFTGQANLEDTNGYRQRNLGHYDFSTAMAGHHATLVADSLGGGQACRLDSSQQYSPNVETTYEGITTEDHAWIRASVRVRLPEGFTGETPCLVVTMARREGSYGYRSTCADPTTIGGWTTLSIDYRTPNIRDVRDRLQVYVWHRGKAPVLIDDLHVDAFTVLR